MWRSYLLHQENHHGAGGSKKYVQSHRSGAPPLATIWIIDSLRAAQRPRDIDFGIVIGAVALFCNSPFFLLFAARCVMIWLRIGYSTFKNFSPTQKNSTGCSVMKKKPFSIGYSIPLILIFSSVAIYSGI